MMTKVKMSAMEIIGDALRVRREELKLTKSKASELANIKLSQLYTLERGSKDYTMPVFLRYLAALQMNLQLEGCDVKKVLKQKRK
jgi:transcriptional regulator with XRE-family HTH domain